VRARESESESESEAERKRGRDGQQLHAIADISSKHTRGTALRLEKALTALINVRATILPAGPLAQTAGLTSPAGGDTRCSALRRDRSALLVR
jgi:hypothetical protein